MWIKLNEKYKEYDKYLFGDNFINNNDYIFNFYDKENDRYNLIFCTSLKEKATTGYWNNTKAWQTWCAKIYLICG